MSDIDKCKKALYKIWEFVQEKLNEDIDYNPVSKRYQELIRSGLVSRTKSYHYVLPTQLLAKYVFPEKDARSIQASYGEEGSFDARTIAHKVIVPFDKENYNVLGGSSEPYVNNPLRYQAIIPEFRQSQKNKQDWDILVEILGEAQRKNDPHFIKELFIAVLIEIYHLLTDVKITYPLPNRISLLQTENVISTFISEKSGGERIESVIAATFQTIKNYLNLFDEIIRAKINAADSATGMVADIECKVNNETILAVEVKDKVLTITQFDHTIENARANRISEILFIANKGINKNEKAAIEHKINQEFISGQNIYIDQFPEFLKGILILFGEKGRVQLLAQIGIELDRIKSRIEDRKRWRDLLRQF